VLGKFLSLLPSLAWQTCSRYANEQATDAGNMCASVSTQSQALICAGKSGTARNRLHRLVSPEKEEGKLVKETPFALLWPRISVKEKINSVKEEEIS
jgi:hypothetical protein